MLPRLSRRLTMAALGGVSVFAVACGTTEAPDPLSPSGAQGRIRFVNLITDTTRGRVNAILESVPFGVNLTYTVSTPAALPSPATATYSPILTGSRTLVLKRTIDTNTVVSTFAVTITEGQDRTVYAVGGTGGSAIASFVTTDDNTLPTVGTQAKVRVVHLSPTPGAVDLFVTATGADLAAATPVLTNIANQSASAYLNLNAGTYQVRAVPAGTAAGSRAASVIITASVALNGGTVRTIVAADNNVGGAPLRAFVLTDR
ncbi:MAG: DUF4397 domain-containing protein [Gemmatimonadaceae bacterium]|nr:DUF4397 domain-containing protein [Gemmatimonadaceae bacterium]